MTFVPLGERSLRLAVGLYESFASDRFVMEKQILHRILRVSCFLILLSLFSLGVLFTSLYNHK